MNKLYESIKSDIAIAPIADLSSARTSRYYSLEKYGKALFACIVGPLAETESAKADLYEAKDAAGTSAQTILTQQTFTQGTKATKVTVTVATVAVDDAITINSVVFTAKAAESLANRQFNQSGTDTQTATSLAACINDATYGVSGVTASAAAAVVTLTSTVPGSTTISTSETGGATIALSDVEQFGIFELDGDQLTDAYTHVAVKLSTGPATALGSAVILRTPARYDPVSQAAVFTKVS